LGVKKWAELLAWREQHRWHPNQLRHTAATELRRHKVRSVRPRRGVKVPDLLLLGTDSSAATGKRREIPGILSGPLPRTRFLRAGIQVEASSWRNWWRFRCCRSRWRRA